MRTKNKCRSRSIELSRRLCYEGWSFVFKFTVWFISVTLLLYFSYIKWTMAEMASLQDDNSEGKHVQLFRVRMRGVFEKIMAGVRWGRLCTFVKAYLNIVGIQKCCCWVVGGLVMRLRMRKLVNFNFTLISCLRYN